MNNSPPKYQVLMPGTFNYKEKAFLHIIKLRILTLGKHFVLSPWVLNLITCLYKREVEETWQTKRSGQCEDGGRV